MDVHVAVKVSLRDSLSVVGPQMGASQNHWPQYRPQIVGLLLGDHPKKDPPNLWKQPNKADLRPHCFHVVRTLTLQAAERSRWAKNRGFWDTILIEL